MAHKRLTVPAGTALAGAASALALLGSSAGPARAVGAPTVSTDKQCYVDAEGSGNRQVPQKETLKGTGWTPGDVIQLEDKAIQIYTKATADASGNFSVTVPSPIFSDTKHVYDTDTVSATDLTQQGNDVTPVATATSPAFKFTELNVNAPSGTTHLSSLLKYSFVGFNEGTRIYGHYIYKKKLRSNVSFGRSAGPCGLLDTRAKIYPPSSTPAVGDWTVQFDNVPHYSATSLPRVRFGFQIYQQVRSR